MSETKIYSLDYLANAELTYDDLSNLFDHKSLVYSIIIGMFKHIKLKKSNKEIIKMITTKNKWMDNYFWNHEELTSFENTLTKAIKNIYYCSEYTAKQKAQWYVILYGFKIKGNKIDL